jgi:hypothetical protein
MPYDPYAPVNPWWQQRQAPQQGVPFDPVSAPQQPKPWWQGLPAVKGQQSGQSADQPGQSAKPPSLLDMMLNLGRMTPADYNKRIQGGAPSGSYGAIPGAGNNFSPGAAAMVSPWAWLTSMWGGGSGTAAGPG